MSQCPHRRRASVALVVALATLALPAGASAALTATQAGTVVTFDGDAADDALVISDAGGMLQHNQAGGGFNSPTDFDTANAGDQTVPADNSVEIDFNGNAGMDSVAFTTTQVLRGDLTGGDDADTLGGTDGNDTIVGNRGTDTVNAGAGNDTSVWNNGDGTDQVNGEGGVDTQQVNGSPNAGDVFTIKPGAGVGTVRFDRTNLIAFGIDLATTERLQVNGGPGGDTMTGDPGLAPLILLELNGETGVDTLTGGDGPDLITGGDDNDTLNGGAGGDRLVGDRGGDAMNGQAGDDTTAWNNGDGTDTMSGGDGSDRVEVNGAPLAGDGFTVRPVAGGGARFDRTNLVLFGLDITTAELLDVRGLGGDDSLTVSDGTPLGVLFAGNDDNDAFTGANGDDTFLGGSGNDLGNGGAGADVLDGQSGNDTLLARDGVGDAVRCGDGTDTVQSDLLTIDIVVGCESVDAPAPPATPVTPTTPATGATTTTTATQAPDTTALGVRLRAAAARLARNRRSFRLAFTCPAAELGGCEVDLLVTTRGVVRIGRFRARVVLATPSARIAAGQTRRLRVRVPRGIAALFGTRRTLRLRVVVQTTDAAGNVTRSVRNVTLRRPR